MEMESACESQQQQQQQQQQQSQATAIVVDDVAGKDEEIQRLERLVAELRDQLRLREKELEEKGEDASLAARTAIEERDKAVEGRDKEREERKMEVETLKDEFRREREEDMEEAEKEKLMEMHRFEGELLC